MNLNDLNLKFCDYEIFMDAFASFRTRQLQANRVSFLDLSNFKENSMEAEEGGSTIVGRPSKQTFLEDLHVVSCKIARGGNSRVV